MSRLGGRLVFWSEGVRIHCSSVSHAILQRFRGNTLWNLVAADAHPLLCYSIMKPLSQASILSRHLASSLPELAWVASTSDEVIGIYCSLQSIAIGSHAIVADPYN